MSKKDTRDPYAAICLSRLTRILDLDMLEDLQELEDSGNVLKNLEFENQSKPNRSFIAKSTDKINKMISRKGHHQHIFGYPLNDEAVERILPLVDFLKSCVKVEGIFRVPGSKKRQEELKEFIDKDNLAVKLTSGKFTPHDVACVLKQFLAELPEPLLTHAPYEAYLQAAEIHNDQDSSKQKEALQLLFLMIPPENRLLLYHLLDLLNRISVEKESKMTPHNLAVVFSPTILYTKRNNKVSCLGQFPVDFDAMNETVAFMVLHGTQLFKIPDLLRKEIKALKNNMKGTEEEVPMSHTFCQQMDNKKHRQTVQDMTSEALITLYNHMMDMPDGPVKQKFLEKFEKVHPGTPPFKPKSRGGVKPGQLISSTPITSIYTPGSLARYPLSPIGMDNTTNPSIKGFSSCKKGVFRSPEPITTAQKIAFKRFAPYPQQMKTPSGLISPCTTPQTFGNKTRHRRTSSAGSVSFPSFRHKRTHTVHAQDPVQTPSGCLATPQAIDTPSESIRKLYGTPSIRKRITSSDYLGDDY